MEFLAFTLWSGARWVEQCTYRYRTTKRELLMAFMACVDGKPKSLNGKSFDF
jgi:hypothetical protein